MGWHAVHGRRLQAHAGNVARADYKYGKSAERDRLMQWIRLWQFRTWHSGEDLMEIMGAYQRRRWR